MNIFGFTPVDTALAVLGLNAAQLMVDFLFVKTRLFYAVLLAGLLLGVWQALQRANYRPVIAFLIASASVVLVLIPQRQEGTILSATEYYGASTRSSQAIKDGLIDYHNVPVLFSFLVQTTDAAIIGALHAVDRGMPVWARQVPSFNTIPGSVLTINEGVRQGMGDVVFRTSLDKFLHDQYLPALCMLTHEKPGLRADELWPGHPQIMGYYPAGARREWAGLRARLGILMDGDFRFSPAVRAVVAAFTRTSPMVVEDSLVRSIVRARVRAYTGLQQRHVWYNAAAWVIRGVPAAWGVCVAAVYVLFPFLVLLSGLTLSTRALKQYCRILLWIKAWPLGSAVASYGALLLARSTAGSVDPSWAWERPYFCVVNAVLLLCVPVITLLCCYGSRK